MKKRIALFFTLCSMLVLMMGMTAFANEDSNNGFYIMSEECPDEAIAYAQNNLYLYIYDLPIQDERYADIDVSKIVLGMPFTIQKESLEGKDVYYFPIMYEDEIKFTIRVYKDEDGSYTGIFSEYLALELQDVFARTSVNDPLILSMNNGNVMKTIAGETSIFLASPMGNEVLDKPVTYSNSNSAVVNVKEAIAYEVVPIGVTRATSSKYLSLDLAETQGTQQWCSAFAGSAIIRNRTSNKVYAKDVMSYYYPDSSDLENETITHDQLISYAKLKGCSPSKTSSTLAQSTVVSQIDNSKPIYLSCDGTGTYKKANHALVLRGYNTNTEMYSIWNPWHSYYETMPMSTNEYTVDSSSTFKWVSTIYGW